MKLVELPPIAVVSTSKNPPADARRRCLESVEAQRGAVGEVLAFEHHFFDSAQQSPSRSHWENLRAAIAPLPPETVVVSLDGDDWLSRPDALATVARAHAEGAWVTWGQFVYADGRPGFAAPIASGTDIRRAPWVATHVKTYRAGLFQRIEEPHFRGPDGQWLEHGRDLAVMFPAIEMAGLDRCRFLSEVLYVYNYANAGYFNSTPAWREREQLEVAWIRRMKPYTRIEAL